jgi:hypothetical protein
MVTLKIPWPFKKKFNSIEWTTRIHKRVILMNYTNQSPLDAWKTQNIVSNLPYCLCGHWQCLGWKKGPYMPSYTLNGKHESIKDWCWWVPRLLCWCWFWGFWDEWRVQTWPAKDWYLLILLMCSLLLWYIFSIIKQISLTCGLVVTLSQNLY